MKKPCIITDGLTAHPMMLPSERLGSSRGVRRGTCDAGDAVQRLEGRVVHAGVVVGLDGLVHPLQHRAVPPELCAIQLPQFKSMNPEERGGFDPEKKTPPANLSPTCKLPAAGSTLPLLPSIKKTRKPRGNQKKT